MDKITQLKDINGNLVYPKILSESIPDKAINKTLLNSDVTSIFCLFWIYYTWCVRR